MKNVKLWLIALTLMPVAGVSAQGLGLSARVGVTSGIYNNEFEQAGQPPVEADGESIYGLVGSVTLPIANQWAATAALELAQIQFSDGNLENTDVQLSVAYLVSSRWAVSAGYRIRPQGDGFFNDDVFDENGPFVGASLSGLELGTVVGRVSAAYSLSEISLADGTSGEEAELDYDGISVRLGVSLKSAPQHSLEFRYQRFNGDDVFMGQEFEITEEYLQAYYVYGFTL